MMGDLRAHLPTLHWVQQLLTKTGLTPLPILPIHPILPSNLFVVSPVKKVLKEKYFVNGEEVWNKKQQKH